MNKILEIKNEFLMPIVQDLLLHKKLVKIKITGNSMYPFLRHGIDSIEIRQVNNEDLKKYDIVLIKKIDNRFVLHRIISLDSQNIFILGDAQLKTEGPFNYSQVIGVVSGIYRRNKYISTANWMYLKLVKYWMKLIPFRTRILKYFFLKRYYE